MCGRWKLGGISWLQRSPLKSEGSQPHSRPPSPGFQFQNEKSPELLAIKINGDWGWGSQRVARVPDSSSYKAWAWTYLDSLPLSWGSSLKGIRDIWGGNQWFRIREKTRKEATFFQTEVRAEAIVPLMSPPPTEPEWGSYIWDFINQDRTVCPAIVIPWGPAQPNLQAHASFFQWPS